jgi:hypothetical protein
MVRFRMSIRGNHDLQFGDVANFTKYEYLPSTLRRLFYVKRFQKNDKIQNIEPHWQFNTPEYFTRVYIGATVA